MENIVGASEQSTKDLQQQPHGRMHMEHAGKQLKIDPMLSIIRTKTPAH